jgi:DHA1 family bicyclomycin/chloramphenicol resistance-like MFS transporter
MRIPAWLLLLLGVLTAVGPVSIDMYLPAFPQIEADLGGRPGTAQITLATFFAGLAIGQILQGSLADRFGRRLPLLAGTVTYTIASIGCALAPNLFWLSCFRAVAAIGGSASMVIPRAIVRDLATGNEAARMMSRLMLVMGAAPILAPSLGGLALTLWRWQAIFWITAIYGGLCSLLVWRFLPDTLAEHFRVRLTLAGQAARFVAILRERTFITHAVLGGASSFAMFAYIGGSPAVFIAHFGLLPGQFGLVFGLCAAWLIVASQANPYLLPRLGGNRMLTIAVRMSLAAAAVLVGLSFADIGGVPGTLLPLFVSMASFGLVMPNATVGALARQGAHAGSASAVMGTLQFMLGATSGLLVGLLSDGTARPMALLMLAGAVAANIADRCRPRT